MGKFTLTNVVLLAFAAYVCNCVYVIYVLFNPPNCKGKQDLCLRCFYKEKDFSSLTVSVFTSPLKEVTRFDLEPLWKNKSVSVTDFHTVTVNVSIPLQTRNNGTLYAHIFVHPSGKSPFNRKGGIAYVAHPLSKHIVPKDKQFNLMTDTKIENDKSAVTHLHSRLIIHVVTHQVSFHRNAVPGDIYHLLRFTSDEHYSPLLYVDGLSELDKYLKLVNKSESRHQLKIEYSPISIGKLRVWSSVEQTLDNMKALGFSDKDLDDLKGIFTDTNLYFLGMTFSIAILHMLFDFLAFKNDINFWRKKSTMEGLSFRTVLWRCVSTGIIFLYLMDEDTSLLVLVPAGIGTLIEIWKVSKALKVKVTFTKGGLPKVEFGEKTKSESETDEYDSQAMQYLSYALYPLLICGAIYSLIYQPHKSWYSWIVRSAVNGVYAFGFLFMLPQLFVNYKLKSVAHLPWRAFMYKAFNTFIDDVFAFIITMPTAHRLACFRDDVVFLIYLYQRWLYPVDKTRVNEYGMSYENDGKELKDKTD